jgi:hypothetical protein
MYIVHKIVNELTKFVSLNWAPFSCYNLWNSSRPVSGIRICSTDPDSHQIVCIHNIAWSTRRIPVKFSVSDPDSPSPDPHPAFFDQKLQFTYLSLGLHKGSPSYRKSLQPSPQENIQCFRTWNFLTFLFLWVIFALLDPDPDSKSGSIDPIESAAFYILVNKIQIP